MAGARLRRGQIPSSGSRRGAADLVQLPPQAKSSALEDARTSGARGAGRGSAESLPEGSLSRARLGNAPSSELSGRGACGNALAESTNSRQGSRRPGELSVSRPSADVRFAGCSSQMGKILPNTRLRTHAHTESGRWAAGLIGVRPSAQGKDSASLETRAGCVRTTHSLIT